MYITSEHKAPFLEYLSKSSTSAISVRNYRSDVNHFFKWLEANSFRIRVSDFISEYEKYLIAIGTAEASSARKLLTARRLVHWFVSTQAYRIPDTDEHKVVSESQRSTNSQSTLHTERPKFVHFRGVYAIVGIVFMIVVFVLSFPFVRAFYIRYSTKSNVSSRLNTQNIVSVRLKFNDRYDLSQLENKHMLFKIYSSISTDSIIGLIDCTVTPHMIIPSSFTLKVDLGYDCGQLSDTIQAYISDNKPLFTDIFIEEEKLNSSKLEVLAQNISKGGYGHQDNVEVSDTRVGKSTAQLPNDETLLSNTSLYTASTSASLEQNLPLSIFSMGDQFDDGDILAVFDGSLVRAMLSSKIVGIKSNSHILTKGIAIVNMVNSMEQIQPGDSISTSSEPGRAQKTKDSLDTVIGVAIEPYMQGSGKLKIFLQL